MPRTAPPPASGRLSEADRLRRLAPPTGDLEVVLDTDTYNEVDDQFALAYALRSAPLDVRAVYAAPFHNTNSEGPADGMERSYEEIRRVLGLLGRSDPEALAYRGARGYLSDADGPMANPATEDLIGRARDREEPLYVVAIGAPTNVAAAIERAPDIVEDVVVVWLGGQPHGWPTAREFNLRQDRRAARVLFDSGVPLVQIPCQNVAEKLRTTVPELRAHLAGRGDLADYLVDIVADYAPDDGVYSKVIWDVAAVAYLLEDDWVPTHLAHSPHLSGELRYSHDPDRHLVRVGTDVYRDDVFGDLFGKLAEG